MSKRSFKNGKQQAQNTDVYWLWFQRLHDVCLTFVKWSGLPFDKIIYNDVCIYLNELLFRGDAVGFTRIVDPAENFDDPGYGYYDGSIAGYIPIIGQAVPSDALTWYGGSYSYQIKTERNTVNATRDNMALCRPTPAGRSLMHMCAHYAGLLAQAEQSIHVNMINQNTPAIIQSPPGQELTYANMFEQVAGFKPVVYGREGLLGNEKEGIFAYRYLQPAQYVADKLEMLKHDILNDFFNELGISAKSIEKKAQLISDELNIDFSSNSVSKNIFMDVRKDFCKQIKNIFGYNVDCEYNVDMIYAERDAVRETQDNVGEYGGGKDGTND